MTSKLIHRIRTFFGDILTVFINEYRAVITNGDALIIIVGATLMYPLLYNYLYGTNSYKKTPVVVVDSSNGAKSREFVRMVGATPEINIIGRCANFAEAQQLLMEGSVRGIILVSRDFDRNIALHKQADVSVYVDMGSLLYFKNVLLGLMETALQKMADIRLKYFQMQGNDPQLAQLNAEPMRIQGMIVYNNEDTYANYILPAVMLLILHQTLVIGIGIIAGRQYARKKFGTLKLIADRHIGIFKVVLGKALCYMSLYGLLSFYTLGVVPKLFNLPDIGNSIDIMLFLLPFFLSTTFMGLTLAGFMRNDETALLLLVFTSVALLLISGLYWSAADSPTFWRGFRWIIPSPIGINGYVKLSVLGGTLNDVRPEYIALWIQAGVYCLTAMVSYGVILGRFKKPQQAAEVAAAKP